MDKQKEPVGFSLVPASTRIVSSYSRIQMMALYFQVIRGYDEGFTGKSVLYF